MRIISEIALLAALALNDYILLTISASHQHLRQSLSPIIFIQHIQGKVLIVQLEIYILATILVMLVLYLVLDEVRWVLMAGCYALISSWCL